MSPAGFSVGVGPLVATAKRHGSRTALVRIAVEEATILVDVGDAQERERAARLLDETAATCDELGLDWLGRRVAALRDRARGTDGQTAVRTRPSASSALATLRRAGDIWTIIDERGALRLNDGRGIRLLALLLERPGLKIHSLDLVAAVDGGGPPNVALGVPGVPPDPGRAARRDSDGQSGPDVERARINVTRAIRSTLKRIARYDEQLGRDLERTIQTGTYCAYRPDRGRAVRWQVDGRP